MRSLPPILVACLVSALPAAAHASGDLEAGLERFEALEYEDAIPLLERALASEALEEEKRAQAALHLGIIHLAYGDTEQARARFGDALGLDPEIALPETASPHIRELFDEARAARQVAAASARAEARPLIAHEEPEPGRGTTRITMDLDPARTVRIERMVIRHRNQGESFWFEVQATPEGTNAFEAQLPGASLDVAAVEYYIEAFGPGGDRVAQVGSAATPLLYRAPAQAPPPVAEAPRPIHTQWWFWAGSGAVVAAGATAAILILGSAEDPCAATGARGCLQVEVRR
jgi:tetratricopeptide (TPR) repeat protein